MEKLVLKQSELETAKKELEKIFSSQRLRRKVLQEKTKNKESMPKLAKIIVRIRGKE